MELTPHRRGESPLTLSGGRAAYEYGTSQGLPGIGLQQLPAG